jgi:hypothetical protein
MQVVSPGEWGEATQLTAKVQRAADRRECRAGRIGDSVQKRDTARAAYEAGIRQAERFGHGGMAEELRGP